MANDKKKVDTQENAKVTPNSSWYHQPTSETETSSLLVGHVRNAQQNRSGPSLSLWGELASSFSNGGADYGIGLCDEGGGERGGGEHHQTIDFEATTRSSSLPRHKSEGGIRLLRRTEDSLASMGSLLGQYAFHMNRQERRPSVRSQERYRLNVLLGMLLLMTVTVLIVTLAIVAFVTVIQPAIHRRALEMAIRKQAVRDAQLTEQCQGTTWQDACAATLTQGAGARRLTVKQQQRRFLEDVFDESDDAVLDSDDDTTTAEQSIEEKFLLSNDPTVVFDDNCIREYRLTLMWNITFPYRSNTLLAGQDGSRFTMALFVQHGALRDAADYFCSFMHLMRKQPYRDFEEILIIAPHFQYGHDDFLHPRDAFWNTSKPWGDWRVGAESDPRCCGDSGRTVSSFHVLDTMLAMLTNKQFYPNLDKISFLGHSAGGQMVQRYAVMSTLAGFWGLENDINIRFVIANPSSYAYLDNRRFEYNCGNCQCNGWNCTCSESCTPVSGRLTVPTYHGVGTQFPCYQWNYDRWPYGLGSFMNRRGYYIPYALRDGLSGPERALRVYRKLDVVYLVGQNDTCNDGLPVCDDSCWKRKSWLRGENYCYRNQMDSRCPAMLQGHCRRTRAHNYMNYLHQLYSQSTHTLWEVPNVGHNATAMFGSDIGIEVLFGP